MKPHVWFIRFISRIVPQRFRSDWKREWEAELQHRESRRRPGLFRRSLGAFWDALAMQPRRLEEEIFQDLRYGLRMLLKEPGFMLLVGAGLLVNSFRRVMQVDLGFSPERILTVGISAATANPAEFHRSVADRIRALPGVEAASIVDNLPLQGVGNGTRFTIENRPPSSAADISLAAYRIIGPGYFQALGTRLLRGREFTDSDTSRAGAVIVINETMARAFWPGEDPVGRQIRRGGLDGFGPWLTIEGIVRDVEIYGPGSTATTPRSEIYFPHSQFPVPQMSLVIRTESDPPSLASLVRAEIRSIEKNATMTNMQTMSRYFPESSLPAG